MLGLSAYLTGRLFVDLPGIPILAVFLIGIVFGGLLGLMNGALVAFAKVPSLVITLGTLYAYRGINVLWTGSDRINASDLPREFLALGTGQILFIPILTIIALVVLAIAGWLMKNTRGGREFYAIGSDPAAAELYGLQGHPAPAHRVRLSGALAGLAGVLYAARYGTVSSQAGSGWELDAVGAAVIGGVAIFGGSGTVWGAAIGAVLLLTINRALPDPRHARLLAARRGRRAHHRRHRARPRARAPTETRLRRSEGGRLMTATTTPPPAVRTYRDYDRPLWQRVLLTREMAIIALLVIVASSPSSSVRGFAQPITITYLLLDVAPILLIALPMTLIIITGEIDLSVASIVGLASVADRRAHQAGLPFEVAALARASLVGGRRRRDQRLPRHRRRAAVARGHDRHARAVPRARGRPARHHGGHRLPRVLDRPREVQDPRAPRSRPS